MMASSKMGLPSSLTATAPAVLSAAKSVSSSPVLPRVAAAIGNTVPTAPRSGAYIPHVSAPFPELSQESPSAFSLRSRPAREYTTVAHRPLRWSTPCRESLAQDAAEVHPALPASYAGHQFGNAGCSPAR